MMSSDSEVEDIEILSDSDIELEGSDQEEARPAGDEGENPVGIAPGAGTEAAAQRGRQGVRQAVAARLIPARPNRQMVLRDFLRLIAGNRIHLGENAADNAELVNILKDLHVVRSDRVEKALLACPRGTFVPVDYAEDAYLDAPIRVVDMEFNISAPHMHATCLEALDVQKGERFLDVGSGSGVVTACGAYLVGKEGECVGIDIKQDILDFSKTCMTHLMEENASFASDAAEPKFRLLNVFMPSTYRRYFDKIHVGGTCPEERLSSLISLLKPEGKMTVPVGQDLRLITRKSDGRPSQRVLTQVRFSDLQVPSDADIVLSTMDAEQEELMQVPVPPSTMKEDSKLAKTLSEDTGAISNAVKGNGGSLDVDLITLSEPDCVLVGGGWTLSAHRSVLKARCEHFRARFDSGMLDANDGELSVPEQFCHDAMAIFLHYIYKDELPESLSAQRVIEILHVACYYGVPRLVVICESLLAEELRVHDGMDKDIAAEDAPSLLRLADANGLANLQSAVLHYIVRNYDKVSESESYQSLSKREVDMIAKESFNMHKRFKELLTDLSESSVNNAPSRRSSSSHST
ncbi:hypothetical protein BSKO_08280 [Bryopsis sp. KO-2023]|nr:hypothetical protein BSKO_08280 [Bryopsis sp. KO-2023]